MEFETARPRVTPADIQAIAGDVKAQLTVALPDPEPQRRHGYPAFLTATQWQCNRGADPRHKAQLAFGDCLTYAVARLAGEPLLFTGNDFSQTDLDIA
jgi:hypothetical protein